MDLPFSNVWACDFEFFQPGGQEEDSGEAIVPLCAVWIEWHSGRVIKLWFEDDIPSSPPHDLSTNSVFLSYYTPSELICYLELGWELPACVLDLYVTYRWLT